MEAMAGTLGQVQQLSDDPFQLTNRELAMMVSDVSHYEQA